MTQEEQEIVEAAAASDPLGHFVIFFLKTGLRASEFYHLTWSDYNPERRTIFISKSKTPQGVRYVPLATEAQAILESQPRISKFIFTSTTGNPITPTVLKKLYARMQKATGLDFITTHVYRHSFATRLVEKGIDYRALSQLLGHADVAFTLQCYAQPDFLFLQDQIALLEKSTLKERLSSKEKENSTLLNQLFALQENFHSRLLSVEQAIHKFHPANQYKQD